MKNKNNTVLLPVVLALALGLRLVGIMHGFPFIFHPDEPAVIRTALDLRFYPNPGHFDWPHLYMYMNYIMYMVFDNVRKVIVALGIKQTVSSVFPLLFDDGLVFYFLTRMLSAFLGALTVIPVYAAARDSFGKRVGIISALTFAILPFHVWNSHYALIDVPMLFFASWGVFYALNILKRRDVNDYAGAGFYIGLAASTKYNGGLTVLTVPFAHILRVIKNKERLFDKTSVFNLGVSVFTSAVGFLMGTPYAVLDLHTFLRTDGPKGALWQFANVGSVTMAQRIPKFFSEMTFRLADDVGYTVLLVFFLVFALLLLRYIFKKRAEVDTTLMFLTVSGLVFLAYVSGFMHSRSQYYFITYPYLVIVFGYFVDLVLNKTQRLNWLIGFLVFALLVGPPAALSLRNAYIFSREDTRVILYNWMVKNVAPTDSLAYTKGSINAVLDKFGNQKIKTSDVVNGGYSGVEILTDEGGDQLSMARYAGLKKALFIGNVLRQGPNITIYTFNK